MQKLNLGGKVMQTDQSTDINYKKETHRKPHKFAQSIPSLLFRTLIHNIYKVIYGVAGTPPCVNTYLQLVDLVSQCMLPSLYFGSRKTIHSFLNGFFICRRGSITYGNVMYFCSGSNY
jgi:hypothetical protein